MAEKSTLQKSAKAFQKALQALTRSLPIIGTVVLLISLLKTYLPAKSIIRFFGYSDTADTAIGAVFGSILAGNSINSYIIGEQLLKDGAPLTAVTAFLAAWVIVGVVQIPAESAELGRQFALTRAVAGFLFSMVVALVVSILLGGSLG